MTYYQELGVDPRATADEIRRAYRQQIKVFHPDLHADERMRATAEAKLRRLNEIVQVLADPEQRRAYDYELLLRHRNRPADDLRPSGAKGTKLAAVLALGSVTVGALIWIARPAGPEPVGMDDAPAREAKLRRVPPAPPARTASTRQKSSAPEPASGPAPAPGTVPASSAAPAPEAVRASPDPASSRPAVGAPPPAPPPPAAPPPASETAAAGSQTAIPLNPLEGTWLFQPAPPGQGPAKQYPPRYIELRIQTGTGTIFGRFRSSYEVHDQPLSPHVNFNFQAPGGGSQVKAGWLGPGGAQGSVELKLLNPMNLQVDWKTDRTAPGLDLVSGTAVLVKRLDN